MRTMLVGNILAPPELPPYDAVATDPPWGQGKVTYFSHLAHEPVPTFDEMLTALKRLIGNRPSLILMGNRWVTDVQATLGRESCVWPCTYSMQSPCSLLVVPPANNPCAPNVNWKDAMSAGLRALPAQATVFDPFAGYGTIGRLCDGLSLSYVGLELNRSRARRSGLL